MRTRDGGRDIIAIANREVQAKYLIECKHYHRSHFIGVIPVRCLHGVVLDEGATKGIIATTASGFTKAATEHLPRNKWLLEGRDFEGLVEWLNLYQKFKMASSSDVRESRPK